LNFFPLPHGQVSLRPTFGCMAFATVRSWTAILSDGYGQPVSAKPKLKKLLSEPGLLG